MRLVFCLAFFSVATHATVIEFDGGSKLGLANHTVTFGVQHPLRPIVGVLSDCTGLLQISPSLKKGLAVDVNCDSSKVASSYAKARPWLVQALGASLRFSAVQTEVLTAPIPSDPYFRVMAKGVLTLHNKDIPQDFELRCISEPGDVVICRLNGQVELAPINMEPPRLLGLKSAPYATVTGEVSFSRAALRGSRHRPGKDIRERWERIKQREKRLQKKIDALMENQSGGGEE